LCGKSRTKSADKKGSEPFTPPLVIDLSDVPFIVSSASISLEEALHALQRDNDIVRLCGLQPAVRETMDNIGMIESLPADRILGSRLGALQAARQCLACT
jgi:anti-anti-sigma regulatory factor